MSLIAGLTDLRKHGPPADLGTFMFPSTAIAFSFTFSGTVYYAAIRAGASGWVLLSYGTVPETVINTAFTTLGAGARVVLMDDNFTLAAAGIAFSANRQVLEGQGRDSFIDGDALATTVHAINLSGYDDCVIRNLSVQTEDGGGKTCQCIFIEDGSDRFLIENVWIVESDDNGVHVEGTNIVGGRIINLQVLGADADGISVDMDAQNTLSDLLVFACRISSTLRGIDLQDVTESYLINNFITTASNRGIYTQGNCDDLIIALNTSTVNEADGIELENGNNIVANNKFITNVRDGIRTSTVPDNLLIGNDCSINEHHGIFWQASDNGMIVGNRCCGNDSEDTGTYDGIRISGDSDDNLVQNNICNDNDAYGIRIDNANSDRNWIKNNILRGNNLGAFSPGGTDTKFAVLTLPFVEGVTFSWADGSPWGWKIDEADEYAIALGQLPLEVQQVVRWKIWAVSQVTESDAMRLEVVGRGGASDEAYTTESVDVVNKASETTNFAANDVIYWMLDSTDDEDIDDFLGGDAIMIKVLHEAAGNGDVATNADFLCVEIEYV